MCRPAAFLIDGTSVMGPAYVLWLSGLPGRWEPPHRPPWLLWPSCGTPWGMLPHPHCIPYWQRDLEHIAYSLCASVFSYVEWALQ